jgi:DNA-binding MarR family transcriptional regulator
MDRMERIEMSDRPHIASLIGQVKEAVIDDMHERIRDAGFTDIRPSHGCVFRFVQAEGMRPTELAERAMITKQSLGESVADLERLGYVERVPDPTDGRAKLVRLTPKGEAAQAAAQKAFSDIEREWARRLGADRISELRRTLAEIAELQHQAALPV